MHLLKGILHKNIKNSIVRAEGARKFEDVCGKSGNYSGKLTHIRDFSWNANFPTEKLFSRHNFPKHLISRSIFKTLISRLLRGGDY